jgi:hypothetical protein
MSRQRTHLRCRSRLAAVIGLLRLASLQYKFVPILCNDVRSLLSTSQIGCFSFRCAAQLSIPIVVVCCAVTPALRNKVSVARGALSRIISLPVSQTSRFFMYPLHAGMSATHMHLSQFYPHFSENGVLSCCKPAACPPDIYCHLRTYPSYVIFRPSPEQPCPRALAFKPGACISDL